MSSSPSRPAGFTLASFDIRGDREVVLLAGRVRALAGELGLGARAVRGLSAATYELVHGLGPRRPIQAEVRLGDGPSLVVMVTVPRAADETGTELRRRIARILEPLRPMVPEIHQEPGDTAATVCLRAVLPDSGVIPQLEPAVERGPALARSADDIPAAELRQRYQELAAAFAQLQQELEETNRGVVALFAELDANADKLRQAEDRLRLLLDSVQDYAICMLTPDGAIASWNSGAERLFGYTGEEVIGRQFEVFYPPAERERGLPVEHLRIAGHRGRHACESTRLRRGDAPFDAHVVLTVARRGRELEGFSLVVRDITERKRLEHDLRRRAEELAAANRAKEDFLATLSHELRTPLNAMLGWARLLRTGKLEDGARERALETIERNARIQEQLIADLLDISRIVTGKLRMELRPVELQPIVLAAVDSVRPAGEAKGIRLIIAPSASTTVLGDPDRLQQVVWNLLVNAIKFTPSGGEVAVRVERSGAHAVVTVADTGEGIAPELQPFIFDRFTQGDKSMTRPHGGLGLGLSIVRHIVELHGGRVQAQSEGSGRGATFCVYLPVRAGEHAGRTRDESGADASGGSTAA